MNAIELRECLSDPRMNLSKLARLSEVPLRTLRRIKNGHGDVLASTVEKLEPAIKTVFKASRPKKGAKP